MRKERNLVKKEKFNILKVAKSILNRLRKVLFLDIITHAVRIIEQNTLNNIGQDMKLSMEEALEAHEVHLVYLDQELRGLWVEV